MVVNTGAAFVITSQNAGGSFAGSSSQTVTWNVAGTTANGINTANVRILLSIDSGLTFPTVLVWTGVCGGRCPQFSQLAKCC